MSRERRKPNPYQGLPSFTRWTRAITSVPFADVDPVADFPFKIGMNDRVATAGSCFAQHIARHLRTSGYNYFVKESGHAILKSFTNVMNDYNYGTFSCRYGNIYTARQLVQLIRRATGTFEPIESVWEEADGVFLDPFRPAIQPHGFISAEEVVDERRQHLRAVKEMFAELDVFVFTLGLTEYWYCREDGAALPVCPGVAGGEFDDTKYAFGNQTVDEIVKDFEEFLTILGTINDHFRVILTVSPVPLAATALPRHVLTSTTYSKSVLRVAAEMIAEKHDNIGYFPSYEVITGGFNRGRYFGDSLRDVTEEGVQHVMRLFMKHVGGGTTEVVTDRSEKVVEAEQAEAIRELGDIVATVCEEALIENAFHDKP